ncbi:hypothetical protein SCYAM73S_08279 [Streptomyces cyaneofuscatus]
MWRGWRGLPPPSAMSSTDPGRSPRPRASVSSPPSRSWATGPTGSPRRWPRAAPTSWAIIPDARQPFFGEMAQRGAVERRRARQDGPGRQHRLRRRARGALPARVPRDAGLRADPRQRRQRPGGRPRSTPGTPGWCCWTSAPRPSTTSPAVTDDLAAPSWPCGTCWSTATSTWPAWAAPPTPRPSATPSPTTSRAGGGRCRWTSPRSWPFEAPYNRYDAYRIALEILAGPLASAGDLLLHRRPGDRRAARRPRTAHRRAGRARGGPGSTTSSRPGPADLVAHDAASTVGHGTVRRGRWCWTTRCGSRGSRRERLRRSVLAGAAPVLRLRLSTQGALISGIRASAGLLRPHSGGSHRRRTCSWT